MNARQLAAYRRLRRIGEFVSKLELDGEPRTLGSQHRDLDQVLEELGQLMEEQESASRRAKARTAHLRALRGELWRKHMLPVSRVAREVLGPVGRDVALRMPKVRTPHERVLTAAKAMADTAEPHAAELTENGLSRDFLSGLRDAAQRLDDALIERETTHRRRITATAALEQQLRRGRRAVRLLNAILVTRLARNAELLAAWRNVTRAGA